MVFALLLSITGCHNYYMASPINKNYDAGKAIDSLKKQNKFFILRNGYHSYYMDNVSLSDDNKSLNTTLHEVPPDHTMYIEKERKGKMMYKRSNSEDRKVFEEAHVYIATDTTINTGNYVLQLNDIKKIELIQKDKKRTTGSYLAGALVTVGATALVIVTIAALALASAPAPVALPVEGSCPYISAYTGNKFETQGEIFTGAIYPQLARNDYMPLQMEPTEDGKLLIKISNQLKNETEHTDMADLIVVTHDNKTKVLPDENGNLYSISNPQIPEQAWSPDKGNVLPLLAKEDDNEMLHFDDTLTTDANNYVVTQFKNPGNISKANLVLSVKNTRWLDYLYNELGKQFGSYYPLFIKKQNKKPASELIEWSKEQHIPLKVSVKTKMGWQTIAELNSTGLLATREEIVPIDLSNIGDEPIQIKLSSGFMFWDIDYAAIDFSNDKNFTVEEVLPSVATDEAGKNVLPQLMKSDGSYLEQPLPGNTATIEYTCKPQPVNTSRSYILHTSGYYTHSWVYKGSPNIAFLKQLKHPDVFPLFSLELYKKFMSAGAASVAKQ